MDYGDYYWGLYGDYDTDPFLRSLLSTRQFQVEADDFRPAGNGPGFCRKAGRFAGKYHTHSWFRASGFRVLVLRIGILDAFHTGQYSIVLCMCS